MNKPKSKVMVQIFGENYALKGDGEPERIMELAAFLDSRMKQAARGNPSLTTTKIAVLTALNLADEYMRLDKDYKQIMQMLKKGK